MGYESALHGGNTFSDPDKWVQHRMDYAVTGREHSHGEYGVTKNDRDVVMQTPREKARERKRDPNKGFGAGAKTSKAKDEL